MGILMNL